MARSPDPSADGARRTRPPPPLTEAWLLAEARRHLQRYWPSVHQLRVVLRRRVDRSLGFHGGDREQAERLVEQVLAGLVAEGALDDARYARAWVADLHRRGIAGRAIAARLVDKGVDAELARQALAELEATVPDGELVRACAYARRRRLGAARPESKRPADRDGRLRQRQRDLAALCRAGFSFGVARRVVDADDLDSLLEQADGGAGSTW